MSEEYQGLGAPPAGHSNKALTQELYDRIKSATGGKVLVFQEGDVCRMIGDDAVVGTSCLKSLAVGDFGTRSPVGSVVSCITFSSSVLDACLANIIAAGKEVAVCEYKSDLDDVGGVQRVESYVVESKVDDSDELIDADYLVSMGWLWDSMSFTARKMFGDRPILRSPVQTWIGYDHGYRQQVKHLKTRGDVRRLHEVLGWEVSE